MLPLVFHYCTYCWYATIMAPWIPPKPSHPWLLLRASSDNEPQTSGQVSFWCTIAPLAQKPPSTHDPLSIPINGVENAAGTRSSVSLSYINGLGGAWLRAPLEMGALVLRYGVRSSYGPSVTLCNNYGGAMLHCVTLMAVQPQLMSHHPSTPPYPLSFTSEPLTVLTFSDTVDTYKYIQGQVYILGF